MPHSEHGWRSAALSHPEIVGSIHTDYLKLGARVIVANTFATGANILRDVGVLERFEDVNHRHRHRA